MTRPSTFLWIGGTTRAGTTTLFDALSDHPDVCPSYIKQTGFFLDPLLQENGLKSLIDPADPTRYLEFFRDQPDAHFLLDATPDYLYSPGTAQRLRSFAGSQPAKCLFILRNPIDRFASWYSYGKQASLVPSEATWDEFMRRNREDLEYGSQDVPFLAKQTGLYSQYLTPYYKHFPAEDIKIVHLENFAVNPNVQLQEIAEFAGMDASFFKDYEVNKRNANYAVRNDTARTMYRRIREVAVKRTYQNGLLYKLTLPLRRFASSAYRYLNATESNATPMPTSMTDELRQFYQGESQRLEGLTGTAPPWEM